MPPSAMTGTLRSRRGLRALHDRADHRHADAGDDARRADRAGADADLHRVDARRRSAPRSLPPVATLPATRSVFGNSRRMRATMSMTPCEWPCAVSTTSTSTPAATSACARSMRILRHADRRAAAQAAERVLARVRILDRLLDVLDGDQPLQPEVLVDDQQLLDLVLVQDLARLVERRADRHGEQRVAWSSPRRSAG